MTDLESTDHSSAKDFLRRLQAAATDYDFDSDQNGFRSSYGSWHFVGRAKGSVQTPAPSTCDYLLGDPIHPCLDIDNATPDDDSYNFTEDTNSTIVAEVSSHTVRLEREYHLADMLYRERRFGYHHFVRPIAFRKIDTEHEHEAPLAVMMIAAPGDNYLADMASLAPSTTGNAKPVPENGRMPVHKFIDFAIKACECIETMHYRHGLVHGEVRPDTFFLDSATRRVRILNSGCGIRSIVQTPGGTGLDQGGRESDEVSTGFYAPEQTGRFGAASDTRTDLYSLGISFWSILLNQHAFSGKDAANTLQNMLFRKLHSVTSQRPDVPAALSAVIGKMIKRSSQDRYASVTGVKHDLKRVNQFLIDGDTIALANFRVAEADMSCLFTLPKHLIGRHNEQEIVKQTMDKVLRQLAQSLSNNAAQVGVLNSPSVSDDECASEDKASNGTIEDDHDQGISDSDSIDSTCAGGTTDDSINIFSTRPKSRQKAQNKDSVELSITEVMQRSQTGRRSLDQELGPKLQVSEQLRRGGKVEVLAFLGATGRGKTALVRHIRDSTKDWCYFSYAKFDRTKDRPFEALFQLLSALLLQIFSENDTSTMFHKTLQEFIAPHWNVFRGHLHLAEMSAETLLGSFKPKGAATFGHLEAEPSRRSEANQETQDSRPDDHSPAQTLLKAGSSNNSPRFVHVLLEIFRLMAVQKLVCLCVDDLRYADTESMEFISSLVETSVPLVIVLTTQSASCENDYASRLVARAQQVELGPFNSEEIEEYVSATMQRPIEYCVPLASLLEERTGGYPALMADMLDQCYRTRGLYYCWKCSQWEYKQRTLVKHFTPASEHKFETNALLLRHFSNLSEPVQAVLNWASVIGFTFSLRLLQDVASLTPSEGEGGTQLPTRVDNPLCALQAAISRQIIRSSEDDDCYRFSDDNYFQAATLQSNEKQRAEMSYIIACAMLDFGKHQTKIGSTVDVFDHARQIVQSADIALERGKHIGAFGRILTQTAETSRDCGALSKASNFFRHAVRFLRAEAPRAAKRYGLMLQVKAAESFALISDHAEALELLAHADEYAENRSDQALIAVIRSRAYGAKGDHEEAFRTLRDALDFAPLKLGSPSLSECDTQFWPITKRCLKVKIQTSTSNATDDHKALASLLLEMLALLFWRDEARAYQVALVLVQMHCEYGTLPGAALGLIHLAAVAMFRFGDTKHANTLRNYAFQLLGAAKHETYLSCRFCIKSALLLDHLDSDIQAVTRALSSSTEASASAGDQSLHLLNLAALASVRMEHSDDLGQIETYIERSVVELYNWRGDTKGGVVLLAIYQCVRALRGKTNTNLAETILDDDKHHGQNFLRNLDERDPDSEVAWAAYTACEITALFIYGFSNQVLDRGTEMLPILQGYRRLPTAYRVFTYLGLAIALRLRQQPDCEDKEELLELFDALKSELQQAAVSRSPLHSVWTYLLAAEDPADRADVNDQSRASSYDRAIRTASQARLTLEESLSLELYAKFLLTKDCIYTAYHLLNLSISGYMQISAFGKAQQLRSKYQHVLKNDRLPRMVLSVPEADSSADLESPIEHAFMPPRKHDKPQEGTQDGESDPASDVNTRSHAPTHAPTSGLDMLDLQSMLHASQQLSAELDIERLYNKLSQVLLTITGAEACAIVAESDEDQDWFVAASNAVSGIEKPVAGGLLKDCQNWLLKQTVTHVLQFQEDLLISSILDDHRFHDPPKDVLRKYPDGQSVLCLPIVYGERTLLGAIYCEAHPKGFSHRMVTLLKVMTVQTSISIFNALLFKKTEKMSATCASMVQVQKEALAQARQADKKAKEAEAKSMFLANVSHELRTPLNGIVGMTEILKTTELDEKQVECTTSIGVCADTLLGIINDILDFSKLEAGKMQAVSSPFNLADTLRETLQTLAVTNRNKEVKLEQVIEISNELVVVTDHVRLQQVFMNLVSNAFKFTPKGTVTVRARLQREDSERAEVNFAVEDTGIGVPADQVGKLFAPFSQADASTARKYGGTGLGLSICKAIVERIMDGRIWLRSIPNVGTTVAFFIPFRKVQEEAPPRQDSLRICSEDSDKPQAELRANLPVKTRMLDVPRDQIRLAIAEDNPINRRIAISYVSKLKIKYEAYEDGRQAVDALIRESEEGSPFHIVLMDVQMPVLDGCGATQEIRKHSNEAVKDVVVIAMTASAVAGDRERCLEAGMDNYLAKPVRLSAIKEMLDQYVKP